LEEERRINELTPTDEVGDLVSAMSAHCLSGAECAASCTFVVTQLRELARRVQPLDDVFASGVECCADCIAVMLDVSVEATR
jgi:hypothetical protein